MRRPVRPYLASVGRGLKVVALSVARWIGPYELCEAAVGVGAYLVARGRFDAPTSLGIALIVGAGLACIINLLTDLSYTKHVEGSKR